jgi:hypothetical protein
MSTRNREPEVSGPLKFAPKWARVAEPAPARAGDRLASEPRPVNARPPERKSAAKSGAKSAAERHPTERNPLPAPLPQQPAPSWKPAKRPGSFEGDVAIMELRERMALAPDQPPEPPMRDDGRTVIGIVGRFAGLVALAAVAAYGFVWISAPRNQPDRGFALAADQNAPFGQRPAAPAVSRAGLGPASLNSFKPAVFQPAAAPAGLPRDEAPAVDRPQLLAPVPWPAPDAGRALAARTRETPTTGTAALAAVPAALAALPAALAVVPAPHAAPLRPTPAEAEVVIAAPPAAAARSGNEDIATLLARGRTYLTNGDVSTARLAFRRAAEGGDAQAALALGGTFDPLVLKSLGAIGVAADPDQARGWYQKAAELGSRDAPQRLDQLARSTMR